ncbi:MULTISPECIES: 50S ribosomal protein L9 [Candidatus Ichthyocystis]|uniref:Large ribosomal subunit protein bL9 n=1 Tax=Candidatus Ichthyocystis hellenicum TaxID=1561003 RepID=A0A0S4M4J4_9BURK|nr:MULTISPECIES: 50S ribosomal protein L9 [Ichthyocystis]CUT17900.1 50S ribosomal protein L9 [Candidatus Ichthyocystis hellenicum]
MEVILIENIPPLGKLGDIVSVKMGYARNFLLPSGKVKRATEQNKKEFDVRREELEKAQKAKLSSAQELSEKMSGLTVQIVQKAGVDGRLFGSVSVADILFHVNQNGFSIDKRSIVLSQPIKTVGDYEVVVSLHPEVSVSITVSVLGEN